MLFLPRAQSRTFAEFFTADLDSFVRLTRKCFFKVPWSLLGGKQWKATCIEAVDEVTLIEMCFLIDRKWPCCIQNFNPFVGNNIEVRHLALKPVALLSWTPHLPYLPHLIDNKSVFCGLGGSNLLLECFF